MENHFLNPKTIAIIGASDHYEKVGGILMKKLLSFRGNIVPVNLNHDSLFGIKCYKSVLEFPSWIDLAVIAIPAKYVFNALKECGKKRIKNVIIISAGFAEAGNKKQEMRLVNFARKNKIRILGPNCFGVCNPFIGLDLTFSKNFSKKGNTAFISQSGALWSYVSDLNVGISGFISLGNMADLEFSDFIDYFSNDKNTKSIILYVEKVKDGKRFIEICKKCKKRIFVVKTGKSIEGKKAAISHTGSLATDYEIYKGAFKQAGVILCDTLEEAFSIKSSWQDRKKINIGRKTGIITNAGGAAALTADYLLDSGVEIMEIKDLLGTASSLDYKIALKKMNSFKIDSILVILTPQSMTEVDLVAKEIIEFKNKTKKKIFAFFLGDKSVKNASAMLIKNDVVCFNNFGNFRRSL